MSSVTGSNLLCKISVFIHSYISQDCEIRHLFSKQTSQTINKLNCKSQTLLYKQFQVHLHKELTFGLWWLSLISITVKLCHHLHKQIYKSIMSYVTMRYTDNFPFPHYAVQLGLKYTHS